jgi:hypothetical protein
MDSLIRKCTILSQLELYCFLDRQWVISVDIVRLHVVVFSERCTRLYRHSTETPLILGSAAKWHDSDNNST